MKKNPRKKKTDSRAYRSAVAQEIQRLFMDPLIPHVHTTTSSDFDGEKMVDFFFHTLDRVVMTATLKRTARIPGRKVTTGTRFINIGRQELAKGISIIFSLDKVRKYAKIELETGTQFLLKEKEWELFREKLTNIGRGNFVDDLGRPRYRNKLQGLKVP
jgi:hypothetical protein